MTSKPTFWTDDGNGPTGLRILVGSGRGRQVTPKEGIALQRQYVAWLQEIKSKKPLAEAEAVLRMIEIAVADEDYKKTLYKD